MRTLALTIAAVLGVAIATAAPAQNAPAASAPAALYQAKCGMCHLEGGTGTFMLGRRMEKDVAQLAARKDLDRDYVRLVVRQGLQSMPRFTRVELLDAELDQIANYLAQPKKGR